MIGTRVAFRGAFGPLKDSARKLTASCSHDQILPLQVREAQGRNRSPGLCGVRPHRAAGQRSSMAFIISSAHRTASCQLARSEDTRRDQHNIELEMFSCLKRLSILFLFSTIACAQYIPVHAKLTDGTGNVSKTAFLHFELQNCGSNFPIVRKLTWRWNGMLQT
jgi:hypothetical protein